MQIILQSTRLLDELCGGVSDGSAKVAGNKAVKILAKMPLLLYGIEGKYIRLYLTKNVFEHTFTIYMYTIGQALFPNDAESVCTPDRTLVVSLRR
jgi:hypothetical protein